MTDWMVQVDLSDQAADFRRLALQPGMGLIDRSGAHAAILRKWLGAYLAEPSWDGNFIKYRIRAEDGTVLEPKRFLPLTAQECKGAFRSEIAVLAQKLEAAPARTGTERALRHVMLERLKKLQADPQLAAASGALAKYLDPHGVWQLVWLWGMERKTSDPAMAAICKKPDCRTLTLLTEDRQHCPVCGTKLKVSRSARPMFAAALLLLLLAGGAGYWFTRPPAETPAGHIALLGQVFSAQGEKPIAGARVRWEGRDSEVQTDAEGRFELADVPRESVTLRVTAPGFREETLEANLAQTESLFLKVPLRGAAKVKGIVRDRIKNTPIAGAAVSLPAWGISARTDDQGRFHMGDLPGGQVQIAVSAEGFEEETIEQTLSTDASKTLEFLLGGRGKLVGTVIDALTLGPVPEATVFLLNTPLTATTDPSGRFEIAGIPTGAATIAVQAAGYQAEHTDQVLQGTEVRPFLVGLHGAGLVRGRVLAQADGLPLAGASVELHHPKYQRTAQTDGQGEFVFPKLPPGEQDLRITRAGFREARSKIRAEENGEPVEVLLVGAASLSGRVTEAVEKKPLANVEVRIAGTELVTTTGEDGKFQLPNVPGRNATVLVVGRGYRQQELPQTFEADQEARMNVELKGGTILSGLIKDAVTKSPIAQAEIMLADSGQKTQTDAEGRFRFEDLPAGKKVLNITRAGYQSADTEAELKAEEESTVEITLNGAAVLSGTVVSALGEKPLAGAVIKLARSSREVQTDEKGAFRLENVPSGPEELEITLAGYQPGRVSRDLLSGEETPVDIVLTGAAALSGRVVDLQGHPLGEAVIKIENTEADAATEGSGRFQLQGLIPGEVKATISAKGFHPEQKTVSLDPAEPTSLGEIKLRPIEQDPIAAAKAFETPAPEGVIALESTVSVDGAVLIPRADFRTRLERANAQTGDVQVSLVWDNGNDIDLHVQAPSGEVIFYRNRHSRCGGELDVDMNANGPDTDEPVENIYWPLNTAPRGKYRVLAHHYANHGAMDPTEFRVAVKNGDEVKYYTGKLDPKQKVLVCEFERLTGPDPVPLAEHSTESVVPMHGVPVHGVSGAEVVPVGNGEAVGDIEADPRRPRRDYHYTEEQLADQRLKLAEDLLALNKPDAAKRWLEDVSQRYPSTQASRKSRKLLDQLSEGAIGDTAVAKGIYLADLTPVRQNVGGELEPRPVQVAGETQHHSLWTRTNIPNPPATVEYALGRRYARLSGAVGIDDSGLADRTRVSTRFQIVGDGKVLWSSQPLRDPGKSERFELDVSLVNNLKILTESNRLPSHYAIWIDPWLAGKGKTP